MKLFGIKKELILTCILCLLLIGILIYLVITAEGPVEIEISETTCLTSYCLVGQKVAFNLKMTPNGQRNITNFRIESDAIEQSTLEGINRDFGSVNEHSSIPISFTLKNNLDERDYTFSIKGETTTSWFSDFFWMIKKSFIDKFTNKEDVIYKQDFAVRYPEVDFEFTKKEENAEKLEATYDLDFRNKDTNVIDCKVSIETSTDAFIEHHLLNMTSEDQTKRVYESPYTDIKPNENGNCCNTILLHANTMIAEAQIIATPICRIDGSEVVLKNDLRKIWWKHNAEQINPNLNN